MSTVEIHGVAAGGSGVGRLDDGMIVFVPRTAPGDHVEVELVEKHKNWATGRIRAITQHGDDRTEPECPHYVSDRCGGCQLQHLTADAQLEIKAQIVGDALRRIARRDLENPTVEPSNRNWHYRRKLTLHRDAETRIGLHRYDDPVNVFELKECKIVEPALVELWLAVSTHRAFLPRNFRQIVLSLGRDDRRHIVVVTEDGWRANELVAAVGQPDVCFWIKKPKKNARLVAGPKALVSPLSFEQANDEVASTIRNRVVESLAGPDAGVAWDLYGGFGDTARLLAKRGYQVWSVDRDPDAHEWAREFGSSEGINWISGLAEQMVKEMPAPDVVVVNPPRTGMPPHLCQVLEKWGAGRPAARMGYISCDPATLARDLSRLSAFSIVDVAAYDLFPQTSHVETAVVLQSGVTS